VPVLAGPGIWDSIGFLRQQAELLIDLLCLLVDELDTGLNVVRNIVDGLVRLDGIILHIHSVRRALQGIVGSRRHRMNDVRVCRKMLLSVV